MLKKTKRNSIRFPPLFSRDFDDRLSLNFHFFFFLRSSCIYVGPNKVRILVFDNYQFWRAFNAVPNVRRNVCLNSYNVWLNCSPTSSSLLRSVPCEIRTNSQILIRQFSKICTHVKYKHSYFITMICLANSASTVVLKLEKDHSNLIQ